MEKTGIVWIETILYVLISLAVIGMLLAVVQPKITQIKDSIIIDQTKQSLSRIDETILNTKEAVGMRLFSELKLGQGQLLINATNNSIIWTYSSSYKYSEINRTVSDGNIHIMTEQQGTGYKISMGLSYDIDLKVDDAEQEKIIQAASISYKIWFENRGQYINIRTE